MRLISAHELKEQLDRGDPLKLVNALGEWEYRAAHIPGSLHFSTPEETLRELGRDDEIVVYCSNPSCLASVALYELLGAERLPEHSTLRWRPAGVAGGRVSAGRGDGGCPGRRTQDLSSLDATAASGRWRRLARAADFFSERTAWVRRLQTPLRQLLRAETGGAAVVLMAAVAALVWVNLDAPSYQELWGTERTGGVMAAHLRLTAAGLTERRP